MPLIPEHFTYEIQFLSQSREHIDVHFFRTFQTRDEMYEHGQNLHE
jgi:hypothetical protein